MQLHPSGPTPAGKGGAEDAAAPSGFHSRLEGHRVQTQTSVPPACGGDMGARKRWTRSRRSRDSPMPTPCIQALCFDPLVRRCLECNLLRTPDPPRQGKTGHGDRRNLPQGPQPGSATCPSAEAGSSGSSWSSPPVSLCPSSAQPSAPRSSALHPHPLHHQRPGQRCSRRSRWARDQGLTRRCRCPGCSWAPPRSWDWFWCWSWWPW